MSSITRRQFLQGSSASVALALFGLSGRVDAVTGKRYPLVRVGNIRDIKAGVPLQFNYPDDASPCTLVMLEHQAVGGIGSAKKIVAYSSLCPHMGCPLNFSNGRFVCGCHFSMFDASKNGQAYQGLSSQWLAQVLLRLDAATGNIYAEGIEGLVYGRVSNLNVS